MKRAFALVLLVACRDATEFSTAGDRFEGTVVAGAFARTGLDIGTRMCLELDGNHLQDLPGRVRTSDGRLRSELLRPIPPLAHDPLSTLSYGEGRLQNFLYAASASNKSDAEVVEPDTLLFVSLMTDGNVEVRLVRGAPGGRSPWPPLFGVFHLKRERGPCSF